MNYEEKLINGVKSTLPNGTYSEREINLAFLMFKNGYHYCLDESVSESYLENWYMDSVGQYNDPILNEPIWTDKHIEELFNDFYLIPKKD